MSLYESACYYTNSRRETNLLTKFYDLMLEESGLTIAQYHLLINLARLGKANITHWAERVGLDRSTMIRNIKVLEKYGMVEQVEGHGKVFALSEEGVHSVQVAEGCWNRAQMQVEEFLGKEDAEALVRVSRKIQNSGDELIALAQATAK